MNLFKWLQFRVGSLTKSAAWRRKELALEGAAPMGLDTSIGKRPNRAKDERDQTAREKVATSPTKDCPNAAGVGGKTGTGAAEPQDGMPTPEPKVACGEVAGRVSSVNDTASSEDDTVGVDAARLPDGDARRDLGRRYATTIQALVEDAHARECPELIADVLAWSLARLAVCGSSPAITETYRILSVHMTEMLERRKAEESARREAEEVRVFH